MNSKISNWLLRSDEKFLSTVKDANKRIEHLNRLYRYRANCIILQFVILILLFAGMVWFRDFSSTTFFFLLVLQMLGYLDADSKIRAIRLYELLSATDAKP